MVIGALRVRAERRRRCYSLIIQPTDIGSALHRSSFFCIGVCIPIEILVMVTRVFMILFLNQKFAYEASAHSRWNWHNQRSSTDDENNTIDLGIVVDHIHPRTRRRVRRERRSRSPAVVASGVIGVTVVAINVTTTVAVMTKEDLGIAIICVKMLLLLRMRNMECVLRAWNKSFGGRLESRGIILIRWHAGRHSFLIWQVPLLIASLVRVMVAMVRMMTVIVVVPVMIFILVFVFVFLLLAISVLFLFQHLSRILLLLLLLLLRFELVVDGVGKDSRVRGLQRTVLMLLLLLLIVINVVVDIDFHSGSGRR